MAVRRRFHCAGALQCFLRRSDGLPLPAQPWRQVPGDHPLRPADTSSPRAALRGFIETSDDVYRRLTEVLDTYGKSDRLYLLPTERRGQVFHHTSLEAVVA